MYAETVVWLWYGKIKTGSRLYSHMLAACWGTSSLLKIEIKGLITAYKFSVEHLYMLQK